VADADQLGVELRRVVDRLRALSLDRLAQPAPPWPSRAAAARDAAQVLAATAQGVEERDAAHAPAYRVVPALGPHAAADQVAVTGADLRRAVAATPAGARVWLGAGRAPVDLAVRRATDALAALRRAL